MWLYPHRKGCNARRRGGGGTLRFGWGGVTWGLRLLWSRARHGTAVGGPVGGAGLCGRQALEGGVHILKRVLQMCVLLQGLWRWEMGLEGGGEWEHGRRLLLGAEVEGTGGRGCSVGSRAGVWVGGRRRRKGGKQVQVQVLRVGSNVGRRWGGDRGLVGAGCAIGPGGGAGIRLWVRGFGWGGCRAKTALGQHVINRRQLHGHCFENGRGI